MKKFFTVKISQKDGRKHEDKGVWKIETDEGISGNQIIITFHDVKSSNHYDLMDGTKIEFTEENVKDD